jgi:hypothetical protein
MIDRDQEEKDEVYNPYVSSDITGYQTKEHQMHTTCTVRAAGPGRQAIRGAKTALQ